ncbi:MAG: GGDEF domain-containing protein [Candidatus Omnitrophota bacterium]
MSNIELKSLENASIMRKFSVLFTLTSVLPLVILTLLYFFPYYTSNSSNIAFLSKALFVTALFTFIGFMYMRQSLFYLNRTSQHFKSAATASVPGVVAIELRGDNEIVAMTSSFNTLAQRLEKSIDELEKSKHLLLQALDREQMLSRTDYLTGIANRRVFYELADVEISKFRRYGHPFTVVLLDVDNLKYINDSSGHQAGDSLLRSVGAVIKENIRVTDIAARVGGDEFTILLTETGTEALEIMVPRLRERLLASMNEHNWPATFSIGVATYHRAPAGVDEIMKKVDDLMYAVKREGKNAIKQEVING